MSFLAGGVKYLLISLDYSVVSLLARTLYCAALTLTTALTLVTTCVLRSISDARGRDKELCCLHLVPNPSLH